MSEIKISNTALREALAELVAVEDDRKANSARRQQAPTLDALQENWRPWRERHDAALDAARAALSASPSEPLPCGHPAELLLHSAETGAPLYCELCDDKSGRRDAEQREEELSAKVRQLEEQVRDLKANSARYLRLRNGDWTYFDAEWLDANSVTGLSKSVPEIERALDAFLDEGSTGIVASHPASPSGLTVPEGWRAAVATAYGYLWHVNNEPGTPHQYAPERAAYEARKALRELLTHEQRGEAINAVRATVLAAPSP